MNTLLTAAFNNGLELITLAGLLLIVGKLFLEQFDLSSSHKSGFEMRIPPEKASLSHQKPWRAHFHMGRETRVKPNVFSSSLVLSHRD